MYPKKARLCLCCCAAPGLLAHANWGDGTSLATSLATSAGKQLAKAYVLGWPFHSYHLLVLVLVLVLVQPLRTFSVTTPGVSLSYYRLAVVITVALLSSTGVETCKCGLYPPM